MPQRFIPNRPKNDKHQIPAVDKDTIVYAVIFAIPNDVAFLRFHPEYIGEDGKITTQGKRASKDFWQLAKNQNFRDDYTEYLKEWLKGKSDSTPDEDIAEISEDKKRATITKMLNQLVKLIGNGDVTGDDLKTYSEIMKKVGWLKDEVEEQVKPLRFLPERCFSGCRYRLFVENAVKGGSIIDECQYCKALAFANENGYRDDSTKRLDIPKKVLDSEPENTVDTLDIIAGKIDN